jgi:hypothetical protein
MSGKSSSRTYQPQIHATRDHTKRNPPVISSTVLVNRSVLIAEGTLDHQSATQANQNAEQDIGRNLNHLSLK